MTAKPAAPLTIPLPWTNPPLTGNRDRTDVHAYAAKVRDTKDAARWAIRAANVPPMVGANITLHLRPATKARRDADNLGPTLKVVQDSLVLEGVLPDDSWVHVPRSACQIHAPNGDGPAMWVELSDPDAEPVDTALPKHENPAHAGDMANDTGAIRGKIGARNEPPGGASTPLNPRGSNRSDLRRVIG